MCESKQEHWLNHGMQRWAGTLENRKIKKLWLNEKEKKNAFRLLWSACQHMLETDKKSEKQFADSSEERDRDSVV